MTNYILIIVLLCLSAFFSAAEMAYSSANPLRLKKAAENGGKAKTAYKIFEDYERTLSSILMGNNLVNIAASSVATAIALSIAGEEGAGIAALIMTALIIVFSEIVPKAVAKIHCDTMVIAFSYPLRVLTFITFPVVWLVSILMKPISMLWGGKKQDAGVTEDELSSIIEIVENEGVIDEERGDLLQSAINFSDISAQEILTPRVDMLAIDIDDSLDEIIEQLDDSPYSRIPVYEDTVDNIIGILYLNHFYKKLVATRDFSIRDILIDVCFIHKSLKLPAVLSELKRRQTHIAVVTDEYGGTMGILTMEDVLEQLVGEIWDETDEVSSDFSQLSENTYEADGDMSIYDFLDAVGLDPDSFEGDFTTVGGWAIEMLQGFPSPGDSFVYENLTVTVLETDDLRVTKLKAVVIPQEEDE